MTDRHSGYVVILDRDLREDDAETVISALRMVRGVQSVEPIVAEVSAGLIAEERARTEFRRKLLDFLNKGVTVVDRQPAEPGEPTATETTQADRVADVIADFYSRSVCDADRDLARRILAALAPTP